MRKFSHLAFTLAEMMVVLLIMSIILAAMAPVMTTRDSSMRDNSSPWKWTDDRADTYFGLGDTQTAMIGQKEKKEIDGNYARLIINAVTGHDDEAAHILFKKGEDAITGRLYLSGGNTFLSNGSLKGSVNTAIGYNTLLENESGQANTSIGAESMKQNKGSNNTAVGANAFHLGTGDNNTVVGVDAFAENSGSNNTAIGVHALRYVSGSNNIAIGYQANDDANLSVNDTIAIGQNTVSTGGISTSWGSAYGSIAIGNSAKATGVRSLALGINSEASNYNAIAIGHNTLASGYNSVVLGGFVNDYGSTGDSLKTKATGAHSIAIGTGTLATSTSSIAIGGYVPASTSIHTEASGAQSIAIGQKAVASATNSIALGTEPLSREHYGIAIGYQARSTTDSISIGRNAGVPSSNDSDPETNIGNVAIGLNSLAYSISDWGTITMVKALGQKNVAVGYNAASSRPIKWEKPSEPFYNVSVGAESRIGGRESVAIGYNSEAFHGAVAIGSGALAYGSPYEYNYTDIVKASVAIGKNAHATGQNSVAIGYQSSATNESGIAIGRGAVSSGTNIAIGDSACSAISGSSNVCIGHFSGSDQKYTANQHIYLGAKSKYNNNKAVLEVHNISDTIKTGAYSSENASGVVINGSLIVRGPILATMKYNGASSYDDANIVNGFLERERNNHNVYLVGQGYESGHPLWDLSDRRLKYVGKENTSGLDKIRKLKVFNYTFKKDEKKTPHVGVIAQDLQKIFPDAVKKGVDGFLSIRFEDMFYAMINAIKELDSRITALEKENAELKKRLEVLEAKIK